MGTAEPLPEQLFLDIPVSEARHLPPGMELAEPWATEYSTAIGEKRYGDAIWARYNIFGDTVDGMYTEWSCTDDGQYTEWKVRVEDAILEDARGYAEDRELYQEALEFYGGTSQNDSRRDIIAALHRIGRQPYRL
ncbi:hypothetical protein BO94DRAFT_463722 [Aspergillus sclerotioniger CBS 115572]|uniref:Uncharacterized protein n=1 Tax=Aspergillus sclerotioniger CBS 115572 TaxID=1450535 RepID=A0A317WWK6_9EURO|nr:hypothetical protein BO94DRAFT_463722 [Aspergillus sclerotioniger CBS 115572]PWY89692.1 hypothetical protein BO94DRAFT_463722 [Aspergillus sclerotioniger CBS 115572]